MKQMVYNRVIGMVKGLLPFYLLTFLPLTMFSQSLEQMGGVYYAYPVTKTELVEVPEGYEPFYISHYGRHGSRWLPNDDRYIWVNQQFEDKGRLTKLGKSVRKRLQKVWKDAKGNGGLLTRLGARQHRQIAHRMYENFPQLFTAEAHLSARSSIVGRCRSSMLAFIDELGGLAHLDHLEAITDSADMAWIAYKSQEQRDFEHSLTWPLPISTDRFINTLFTDASHLSKADREKLLSELHTIASDMQDVELKVSLYDIFTDEEMRAVYDLNNRRMTLHNGDEIANNGIAARCATSLWNRIMADADAAIARGGVGANLRFGHDTNFYRLLTLIGVDTKGLPMDVITPMAANLQMIFYKNAQGRVLVQLLHNEGPATISNLSPLTSHLSPLYLWEDLKQHVADRMHYYEHLRQLCALNTMVGTAPANTKTAGLFGKGSEEHGQTLPAVLAPNGQKFLDTSNARYREEVFGTLLLCRLVVSGYPQ